MSEFQTLLLSVDRSHCQAIKRKFAKDCFGAVSTLFHMTPIPNVTSSNEFEESSAEVTSTPNGGMEVDI